MEDGVVETCDNSIQGNKKRDMRTLLVLVFSPIFFLTTLLYARENLAAAEEKARPSLLLITIDTLRADRLPFYGYNRDTAPFLGKLAEQGIVFTNAYSTSSWTVPSVRPTAISGWALPAVPTPNSISAAAAWRFMIRC